MVIFDNMRKSFPFLVFFFSSPDTFQQKVQSNSCRGQPNPSLHVTKSLFTSKKPDINEKFYVGLQRNQRKITKRKTLIT